MDSWRKKVRSVLELKGQRLEERVARLWAVEELVALTGVSEENSNEAEHAGSPPPMPVWLVTAKETG